MPSSGFSLERERDDSADLAQRDLPGKRPFRGVHEAAFAPEPAVREGHLLRLVRRVVWAAWPESPVAATRTHELVEERGEHRIIAVDIAQVCTRSSTSASASTSRRSPTERALRSGRFGHLLSYVLRSDGEVVGVRLALVGAFQVLE